ncbi:MAG: 3',5'-cyclic-AMP phosphodiesterase, partial [Pseudomonadota bacterium]|nr:3',5'-cyclic-AMP phosphodiesterase [Pseudomonadota bacterium]
MSTESLLSGDVVVAAEANTLSLVQVTDTHLTGTETGCFLGMNTARSAGGVIDAALASESADCILVTGDI